MKMNQQRLFDPFVFVGPAVAQRRFINKRAENVTERNNDARFVSLFLGSCSTAWTSVTTWVNRCSGMA